jgi:TrmH family RNA methyltransferase
VIDSPKNPRIQSLLKAVDAGSLVVLEGEKFVLDAAAAGFQFEEILHDESLKPGRLAALAAKRPTAVSGAVLARFSDTKTPQHLVGLAKRREFSLGEILGLAGPAVFLDGVQDPGNVGAAARVVEAAGGAGLLLSATCADAFHPRALRGSAGSLLRLPLRTKVGAIALEAAAKAAGREIIGTEGSGGENVFRIEPPDRPLWIFGGEGSGITQAVRALCDRKISIPMHGPVESLNVAVAIGIVLFSAQARSGSSAKTSASKK